MGVATRPTDTIIEGAIAWNWPSYFANPEEVYRGGGLRVVVQPNQRTELITGKYASNYGGAGSVGQKAKEYGADDSMYLATFYAHDRDNSFLFKDKRKMSPDELKHHMLKLALADGPGEEVVAFTKDGTMLYPPMDVGRLGGTTLDYMIKIAKKLDIPTREAYFCIDDINTGETGTKDSIVSLAYVGNAVKFAPIGRLDLRDAQGQPLREEGPIELKHPDEVRNLRRLQHQYEAELTGRVPLTDPELLTPIPRGQTVDEARELVASTFRDWYALAA